jgi:hypothetical protein
LKIKPSGNPASMTPHLNEGKRSLWRQRLVQSGRGFILLLRVNKYILCVYNYLEYPNTNFRFIHGAK